MSGLGSHSSKTTSCKPFSASTLPLRNFAATSSNPAPSFHVPALLHQIILHFIISHCPSKSFDLVSVRCWQNQTPSNHKSPTTTRIVPAQVALPNPFLQPMPYGHTKSYKPCLGAPSTSGVPHPSFFVPFT